MSRNRKFRLLEELFKNIPSTNCKGLCGKEICGPVPVTKLEKERIIENTGPKFMADEHCPWLDEKGACSIYSIRPFICRLWGSVDEPRMLCKYGCRPTTRLLTKDEARKLARQVEKVGNGADVLAGVRLKDHRKVNMLLSDDESLERLIWWPCDVCTDQNTAVFFSYDPASGAITEAYCMNHMPKEIRD